MDEKRKTLILFDIFLLHSPGGKGECIFSPQNRKENAECGL